MSWADQVAKRAEAIRSNPTGQPFARTLIDTVDPSDPFKNPSLLNLARAFYEQRDGRTFQSDQEVIDTFWEDRTWRSNNTISILRDLWDSETMDETQRTRLAVLQGVYDKMPIGGRGMQGFWQNAAAGGLDIVNLLGFGVGGVAARGALLAGKGLGNATLRGMLRGGVAEAGLNAGIMAPVDVALQERDINIGLQDEYSLGQTAASMGMGAAIGGAFGTVFGGIGGWRAFVKERRALTDWPTARVSMAQEITRLEAKGLSDQANKLKGIRDEYDRMFLAQIGDEKALTAPAVQWVQRQKDIEAARAAARAEVDSIDAEARRQAEARAKMAKGEAEPELDLRGGAGTAPNQGAEFALSRLRAIREDTIQAMSLTSDDAEIKALTEKLAKVESALHIDEQIAGLDDRIVKARESGKFDEVAKIELEKVRLRQLYDSLTKAASRSTMEAEAVLQPDLFPMGGVLPYPQTALPPPDRGTPEGYIFQPNQEWQEVPEGFAMTGERAREWSDGQVEVRLNPDTGKTEVRLMPKTEIDTGIDVAPGAEAKPLTIDEINAELGVSGEQAAAPAAATGAEAASEAATISEFTLDRALSFDQRIEAAKNQKELTSVAADLLGVDEKEAGKQLRAMKGGASGKAATSQIRIALQQEVDARLLDDAVQRYMKTFGVTPEDLDAGDLRDYLEMLPGADRLMRAFDLREKSKGAIDVAMSDAEVEDLIRQFILRNEIDLGGMKMAEGPLKQEEAYRRMLNAELRKRGTGLPTEMKEQLDANLRNFAMRVYRSGQKLGTAMSMVRMLADELESRFAERVSAARTVMPERVTGERGASPGGEARLPNYKSFREVPNLLRSGAPIAGTKQHIRKNEIGALGVVRANAQTKGLKAPQEFIVDRKTVTADGQTLRRGQKAYYSPTRDKVYATLDGALGRRPRPTVAAPASQANPVVAEIDTDALTKIAAYLGITPAQANTILQRELAKRRKAAAAAEAPSAGKTAPEAENVTDDAAEAVVDAALPEGHVIAVRHKTKGVVRVASDSQMAVGATAAELIGRANPDDWEVGSVPYGHRSYTSSAKEAFTPAGQEPPSAPPKTPADELNLNPDGSESVHHSIPRFEDIKDVEIEVGGKRLTIAQARNLIANLSTDAWDDDLKSFTARINKLAALEAAMPAMILPSQTRRQAMADLMRIMDRRDQTELVAMLDILRRLGGDRDQAPEIRAGEPGVNYATLTTVTVDPSNIGPTPAPGRLFHEISHWAYFNLLSGADRLDFMRYVEREFYKNGKLDRAKLQTVLVRNGTSSSNAMESPQELFANLMEQIAVGTKRIPMATTLFTRVINYISELLRRFVAPDTPVSPEMEALFLKIMPDPVADSWLRTIGKEATTERGKEILNLLRTLDAARVEYERAINKYTPSLTEQAGRRLARELLTDPQRYGLTEEQIADIDRLIRQISLANMDGGKDEYGEAAFERIAQERGKPFDVAKAHFGEDKLRSWIEKYRRDLLVTDRDSFVDDDGVEYFVVEIDPKNVEMISRKSDTRTVMSKRQLVEEYGIEHISNEEYDLIAAAAFDSSGGPNKARSISSANSLYFLLDDVAYKLRSEFRAAEGASPRRTENPLTIFPQEPITESGKMAVKRYQDAGDVLRAIDELAISEDVDALKTFADLAARIQGFTGLYKTTANRAAGRPQRLGGIKLLKKDLKQRGSDLVKRAYTLAYDVNTSKHALEGKLNTDRSTYNVRTTLDRLTQQEMAEYKEIISSMRALMEDVQQDMVRIYKWTEGTRPKSTVVPARNRGTKTRTQEKRAEAVAKKVTRQPAKTATRDRVPVKEFSEGDVTSLSKQQLIDVILAHGARSRRGRHVSFELTRRLAQEPTFSKGLDSPIFKTIPVEILLMDGPTLRDALNNAPNKERKRLVRAEIYRRAFKATQSNLMEEPIEKPQMAETVAALAREQIVSRGVPDVDGLPKNTTSRMREVLVRMTHRDPFTSATLKTLSYRLFNLAGWAEGSADRGLSLAHIRRLAGLRRQAENDPLAPIVDTNDPAFKGVRSVLRDIAKTLVGSSDIAESGVQDAGANIARANIARLIELIERSDFLDDAERGLIRDAYVLASEEDPVKQALLSVDLEEPIKAEAWFAQHVTDWLEGNPFTLADLARVDPEMGMQVQGLAQKLKEGTAYVTNGLIESPQTREQFEDLTDYGNMLGQVNTESVEFDPLFNNNSLNHDAVHPAGLLADTVITDEVKPMNLIEAPLVVASAIEDGGAGAESSALMRNMLRVGEPPTKATLKIAHKFSMPSVLNSNAVRIRKLGGSWLADKIQPENGTGIFERHTTAVAKSLVPLLRSLHRLPDSFGKFTAWKAMNKPYGRIKQPKSHDRIVAFLRGQTDKLSDPQEMEVAQQIRRALRSKLEEAKAAGVHMGDVGPNYFPQLWDEEVIRRNEERFVQSLAKYFMREAVHFGREPLTLENALIKARDVSNKLLNEGGFYTPPRAERRAATSDSTDYQRMILLHKTDSKGELVFRENLNELEPFLVNNLEGILAKYFDGATRRIEFEKDFGVNNHAFYDYLAVATEGPRAGAHLLATKRVLDVRYRRQTAEGNSEVESIRLVKMRPMSEINAVTVANEAYAMARDGDVEGAINHIVAAAPHQPDGGLTMRKRAEAVVHGMLDFGERVDTAPLTRDQVNFIEGTFRAIQRKPVGTQSNAIRQASRWMRNFNSVTLLGFTTLTSMTDVMLPLFRSGSIGATLKAWKNYAFDPDYRQSIRNTGIALEQFVHDRIALLHGAQGGRATSAFFNATMLTPWTVFMREVAAAVALEAFKAEQRRALRHGPTSRAYRQAQRRLGHFGIAKYLEPGAANLGMRSLLDADGGDDELKRAIVRFGNETIFAPNPNDIPLWAQTPLGAMMFQLKSYPLMMQRLSGMILEEARHGNIKPLLYMLTIGTGWAAGVQSLKDIAQGRGGDEDKEHALRDRSMTKLAEEFGFDADLHGSVDDFLGWYVDGFMFMGGLGLLADLAFQTSQQVDNGAWGYQRTLSILLGPAVGTTQSAFNVLSGAHQAILGDDNGKVRQAVREIAGRLPVAGGVRSLREGIVDGVAGD